MDCDNAHDKNGHNRNVIKLPGSSNIVINIIEKGRLHEMLDFGERFYASIDISVIKKYIA